MSHTPGPWTVVADDMVYAFPPSTDPEAIAVGYANDAQLIAEVSIVEDARLIAAAPDLLAVLVKYHEWLEEHDRLTAPEHAGAPRRGYIGLDHKIGENVEGCDGCAAIAKAKGEA
jgi:hypothetical protein